MMTFQTCLGDTREPIRFYDDGSCNCPFCSSAVIPPMQTCQNPACDMSPYWTPERLAADRTKREAAILERKRAEETARSLAEFRAEERRRHENWQAAQVAACQVADGCLRCLFLPGWERAKIVHHRGECPKARRERERLEAEEARQDPRRLVTQAAGQVSKWRLDKTLALRFIQTRKEGE